jgi:hypothetical protein
MNPLAPARSASSPDHPRGRAENRPAARRHGARADLPSSPSIDPGGLIHITVGLALAAVGAALVTAAFVAASGSAQAPAGTTLHLVSKSRMNVGFFPSGRPHQGQHVGFGDTTSGDETGYDRGACTIVGQSLLCNIQVQLSKGTLSVQGIAPQRANNTPGTALVTDHANSTDITVTLRAA